MKHNKCVRSFVVLWVRRPVRRDLRTCIAHIQRRQGGTIRYIRGAMLLAFHPLFVCFLIYD